MRKVKGTDQEETEERSFAPSAISAPRRPLFCCDNQCGEKTLSSWQFASVVIKKNARHHTLPIYARNVTSSLGRQKGENPGFERRPKKKGKQEYRVSGSWNRQPESTWSTLNDAMTLTARTE